MRRDAAIERFALRSPFTISRGAKTEAVVVTCTLTDGAHVGRGEGLPYARYGETPDGVRDAVMAYDGPLERGALRARMAPGSARNAIDLALWDLEAKRTGVPVWRAAGLPEPRPLTIQYTIPIRDPDATRALAEANAARPCLKLKLGRDDDLSRVRAAREGAPKAELLVDVNEGWDAATLLRHAPALHALGVTLIEQPVPAAEDAALREYEGPIPLCADESFRGGPDGVAALADRFAAVNIKLDKAGGLTTALECVEAARAAGLKVMIGSMVATSLAVAPAALLAQRADWADLDAPLYLTRDRDPGLRYEGSTLHPPSPALWG